MDKQIIYCPSCRRYAMNISKNTSMDLSVKCSTCNKLVVFHGMTKKVTCEKIPTRDISSGVRFY